MSVRSWYKALNILRGFMKKILLLVCILTASLSSYAKEVETVDFVDVNRYLGTWYDIASYPQWFQKGCTNTKAVYSLKHNGDIKVTNTCNLDTTDGKLKKSVGKAKIVDQTTNSKLKVSFFGPFYGKYWIIDLDEEYQFAVVSDPTRSTLWILSRKPVMDQVTLKGIFERLKEQEYDLSKLVFTKQNQSM
jgi:apolipoprotein D and lipocalin family protein